MDAANPETKGFLQGIMASTSKNYTQNEGAVGGSLETYEGKSTNIKFTNFFATYPYPSNFSSLSHLQPDRGGRHHVWTIYGSGWY